MDDIIATGLDADGVNIRGRLSGRDCHLDGDGVGSGLISGPSGGVLRKAVAYEMSDCSALDLMKFNASDEQGPTQMGNISSSMWREL